MRDTEKSRVYAAESAAFDETLFSEGIGMRGVRELADRLFSHPWWREVVWLVPEILPTRADSLHSSANRYLQRIKIAPSQENCAILAHEAAHIGVVAFGAFRELAPHGPEFRAMHLQTMGLLGGEVGYNLLRDSYSSGCLTIAPTKWSPPSTSPVAGLYGQWRLEQLEFDPPPTGSTLERTSTGAIPL